MEISISERASERLINIKNKQGTKNDAYLKIEVVSGGCSGLTYKLDFVKDVQPKENDQIIEHEGIKILIDMRSFLYLAGTELDYTEGLQGQGFHFHNPNASRTCSCGESFSV